VAKSTWSEQVRAVSMRKPRPRLQRDGQQQPHRA
jgi:hypothetical protein